MELDTYLLGLITQYDPVARTGVVRGKYELVGVGTSNFPFRQDQLEFEPQVGQVVMCPLKDSQDEPWLCEKLLLASNFEIELVENIRNNGYRLSINDRIILKAFPKLYENELRRRQLDDWQLLQNLEHYIESFNVMNVLDDYDVVVEDLFSLGSERIEKREVLMTSQGSYKKDTRDWYVSSFLHVSKTILSYESFSYSWIRSTRINNEIAENMPKFLETANQLKCDNALRLIREYDPKEHLKRYEKELKDRLNETKEALDRSIHVVTYEFYGEEEVTDTAYYEAYWEKVNLGKS